VSLKVTGRGWTVAVEEGAWTAMDAPDQMATDTQHGGGAAVNGDAVHRIRSVDWGWVDIPDDALEDLASFTGRTKAACLERLSAFSSREMGEAWRAANPKTAEEIRAFYTSMDFYLWDLTLWHATPSYAPYIAAVERMAALAPGKRILDYGSGIGTASLLLARDGYQLTIADVPGVTFDYIQHRLRRRGIPFTAVPITRDIPRLPTKFDGIVCFDVLEHVPHPDRIFRHLARHLAPKGIASIVASFDAQGEDAGYHLHENHLRWGDGRWSLSMSGASFKQIDQFLYQRDTPLRAAVRAAKYWFWRLTGLDVRYKSRRMRG